MLNFRPDSLTNSSSWIACHGDARGATVPFLRRRLSLARRCYLAGSRWGAGVCDFDVFAHKDERFVMWISAFLFSCENVFCEWMSWVFLWQTVLFEPFPDETHVYNIVCVTRRAMSLKKRACNVYQNKIFPRVPFSPTDSMSLFTPSRPFIPIESHLLCVDPADDCAGRRPAGSPLWSPKWGPIVPICLLSVRMHCL